MRIKWTQDLSVDVKEIDGQHKELFKRINSLDTALKKGKAKEEVLGLFEFLDEYATIHFRTEEFYMIKYAYPRFPFHKTKHAWFMKELSAVKMKLEKEGPTPKVIILGNNLLITWFCSHIRTTDMALGAYLRPKLARI